MEPLSYGLDEFFSAGLGIERGTFERETLALERARKEVLLDLERVRSDGEALDPNFIGLPARFLAEHNTLGPNSTLARIERCAARMSALADAVVVIGIGGSYLGARSIFEALCHTFHNELPPEKRGGRPRIYFAGYNVDNDSTQALLDALRSRSGPGKRWGIVVVSKSGGTIEPLIAFRIFLRELQTSLKGEPELVGRLIAAVTGPGSELSRVAAGLGCEDTFDVPDGVGGRFSVLSAVGLLPAALMGVDIFGLLRGAEFAAERFKSAPPGQNPALDYAGLCHIAERQLGATIRVLSTWYAPLESFGFWYDQLLSESLGKSGVGTTPITVVNTRDLHSRGQQHQEGRRDKIITNLVVGRGRWEPLPVGRSEHDLSNLNDFADKTLPRVMDAAHLGTGQAYREDRRLTIDLRVPRMDAASLGQLYQTFMLATVTEGRLIGINPYGQPGVEAYKRNMRAALRQNSGG
jgi:glucose-6-phosphate isomerase